MSQICKFMVTVGLAVFASVAAAESAAPMDPVGDYCRWQVVDYAIAEPLCGLQGDPQRGEAVVADSNRGNCIACHTLPLTQVSVFGTIGPPLAGIGARYNEGQLRMRITDSRRINPMSIMPGFYRDPALINRPGKRYAGRTFLSAQQVEDVVAYLKTLQ